MCWRSRLNVIIPVLTRVFTVPRGRPNRVASSDCVKPEKYANSINCTLVVRQSLERPGDGALLLAHRGPRLGSLDRRWQGRGFDRARAHRIRAQPIDRTISRDTHQPSNRRAQLDVVGVGARPDLHEHFLQQFLGLAAVLDDLRISPNSSGCGDRRARRQPFRRAPRYGRESRCPDDGLLRAELCMAAQYSAVRRSAATILSTSGRLACSSTCENGACVSG